MPVEVTTYVSQFHPVDRGPEGAVIEGSREAARQAAGAGFQKSQELVPKDTSELMFSGIPPFEDADGNIVWAYDAPHALPVEFGSRPHWPPIEPLLGWARRVLGDEGLAYYVQKQIAKYGTDEQPYVRPGVALQRLVLERTSIATHIEKYIPGR